jgi:rare lipoprotein A
VTAALVGVGLLTGGLGAFGTRNAALAEPTAAGALTTGTVTTGPASATPAASPTSASAVPSRSPEHASRGENRTAPPTPTPSRTPSKAPSSQPNAVVVDTGTCDTSFYDTGQVTANGETFNPDGLTAASKTLAFNTMLRVTNLSNGKSVVVRINDRGPFVAGRCLDLTRGAFGVIASLSSGVITVKFEVLRS